MRINNCTKKKKKKLFTKIYSLGLQGKTKLHQDFFLQVRRTQAKYVKMKLAHNQNKEKITNQSQIASRKQLMWVRKLQFSLSKLETSKFLFNHCFYLSSLSPMTIASS